MTVLESESESDEERRDNPSNNLTFGKNQKKDRGRKRKDPPTRTGSAPPGARRPTCRKRLPPGRGVRARTPLLEPPNIPSLRAPGSGETPEGLTDTSPGVQLAPQGRPHRSRGGTGPSKGEETRGEGDPRAAESITLGPGMRGKDRDKGREGKQKGAEQT